MFKYVIVRNIYHKLLLINGPHDERQRQYSPQHHKETATVGGRVTALIIAGGEGFIAFAIIAFAFAIGVVL